MPINQISTSNTFGQWVTATSQLITISNSLNDSGVFNTNSTIIISGTGVLNVLGTALINTVLSNTINTRIINVTGPGEALNVANSANVRGNVFVGGNVSIGNLVVRGSYTIDNPSITNLVIPGYANVGANLNVASYIIQTGPQTSSFAGRLDLLNIATSLAASGNVTVSKNVSVLQNVVVGANLTAFRIFGTTGNITSLNVSTMNVDSNLNIFGTTNTSFLNVTNSLVVTNLTVANLTVTSNILTQSTTNIAAGNLTITGVVNTTNLIVRGAVLGDLNVNTGNVIIRQARDIVPGSAGDGQLRILGSGYNGYFTLEGSAMRLGHNSSNRNLTLDVASTPVLTATPTGINIPGNLGVTGSISGGSISGNASGLTNVNFIASSEQNTSNTIFMGVPASVFSGLTYGYSDGSYTIGRTPNWVSTGMSIKATIPTGIDTVDISISASILIESIGIGGYSYVNYVGGPITVSGNFGTSGGTGTFNNTGALGLVLGTDTAAGAGSPDFRYRILRNGVVIFTSEWTQLSTPGSFFGILNTIRDPAPITGTESTYTVEGQWRNAQDIEEARAGVITSVNYWDIIGTGLNFQTYLSTRALIRVNGVDYPIAEIIYPQHLRCTIPTGPIGTNASYTINDGNTIPRLTIKRKIINLVGYRT